MQSDRARRTARAATFLGLLLASGLAFAGPASARVQLHSDFDGDGFDDLAVAMPGYDGGEVENAGAVIIVPGSPTGPSAASATQIWRRAVDGIPGVQTANERWGLVLKTGDFNGDGYDDLAIGSPLAVVDGVANRGDVVILFGSRDGLSSTGLQHLVPDADLGAALFGASLAVGNFNGDPLADLAVGAPGANSGSGAVLVYQSAFVGAMVLQTTLTADMANIDDPAAQGEAQAFGAAIAAGAFNRIGVGPGLDDLAIASRQRNRGGEAGPSPGRIYVAHGGANEATRGIGFSAPTEFFDLDLGTDLVPDGSLYATLLIAGDFDDDGLDDLVIAMPTAGVVTEDGALSRAGAILAMYGGADGFVIDRAQTILQSMVGFRDVVEAGDEFATAIAVTDLNDDGYLDLAIGTPLEDDFGQTDRGNAHFAYGGDQGIDTARRATLHQDMDYYPVDLGPSLDGDLYAASLGTGDFNGDGYGDVAIGIVGKPGPDGEPGAGAVLSLRGSTQGIFTAASTLIAPQTLTGIDLGPLAQSYLGLELGGGTATCGIAALCMRLR